METEHLRSLYWKFLINKVEVVLTLELGGIR
jgi:hypothetical protein